MISRIEYESLNVREAANRKPNRSMRNVYKCPKGHYTFTIDRDFGVTPFVIKCEHRAYLASQTKKGAYTDCKEHAESYCYRTPDSEFAGIEPVLEFYRPSYDYYLTIKSESLRQHLEQGGLALRRIGEIDCYQ